MSVGTEVLVGGRVDPVVQSRLSFIRRRLAVGTCMFLAGCSGMVAPIGAPCGGGQYAEARAILPDTGMNAGDTLLVGFLQHDTQELTELVIWHLWPFSSGAVDPEPDPRVRVVRDDGRVLLDSLGSRYNQPEGKHNRLTWYVFAWIRSAGVREAFYEGFRDQSLWIELWPVGASQPSTRVQLTTDRIGVHPVARCL